MAFQLNAFQEGFAQTAAAIVTVVTQLVGPPSTPNKRTRQEDYLEYQQRELQRKNNNLIMMMAL